MYSITDDLIRTCERGKLIDDEVEIVGIHYDTRS